MQTLQDHIDQKDISQVINTINDLISNSLHDPRFLNTFLSFIEQSLSVSNFSSPNNKLQLINFLDKINRYRETQETERGKINITELKETAKRFGIKAQSAFDTEME